MEGELLAEGMSNEEANAYEVQLIAKYGRLELKTGTLHNRTAGRNGLTSEDAIRVFSNPKTKRKLIRARRRTARDQNCTGQEWPLVTAAAGPIRRSVRVALRSTGPRLHVPAFVQSRSRPAQ